MRLVRGRTGDRRRAAALALVAAALVGLPAAALAPAHARAAGFT